MVTTQQFEWLDYIKVRFSEIKGLLKEPQFEEIRMHIGTLEQLERFLDEKEILLVETTLKALISQLEQWGECTHQILGKFEEFSKTRVWLDVIVRSLERVLVVIDEQFSGWRK